ncbi:MAG: DUF2235 domain-containing protein [Proteobacteria bacterium]|nr:DUF2235 domain-containing protein [Pseudomonadota bacterium]
MSGLLGRLALLLAGITVTPAFGLGETSTASGQASFIPGLENPAAGGTMCLPAPSGATCGGGGPASQADVGNGGVDVGAGNPINITNGNKYQREVDLAALPGVLGLEIVRHYNSASSTVRSRNGLLGRGWRLSYETTLRADRDAVGIVQADGSRTTFTCKGGAPTTCLAADPARGLVERHPSTRGETYRWRWTHGEGAGRILDFDGRGRLTRILAPTGEFVSLLYDTRGSLRRVIDPQGRALDLHYHERTAGAAAAPLPTVARIASPVGSFRYRYGADAPAANPADEDAVTHRARRRLLVAVSGPRPDESSAVRLYHYEDPRHPTLLTGISLDAPEVGGQRATTRLSTYAYDEDGRAVLSATGAIGTDTASLRGSDRGIHVTFQSAPRPGAAGTVQLTDDNGSTTTYRIGLVGGGYRLLESRGAGCSRCPPANRRYGYDALGRLTQTTMLDAASGQPRQTLTLMRDALGRILRVTALDHRAGPRRAPRLLQRYEYAGDDGRPVLIARPSVVEGQEHRISLTYNAHGQLVQMHEAGFEPVDEQGRTIAAGRPIERSTVLRYTRINGRSLLAEIDGPLPNGPGASPADSDITRLQYDAGGNWLESVTHPMALVERFERDEVGRVIAHTPVDGVRIRFLFDHGGFPVRWQRADAVVHIERDAMGRPIRIESPDGEVQHLGYDGPDGLGAMVSNLGGGGWLPSEPLAPGSSSTGLVPQGVEPTPETLGGVRHWPGFRRWLDDFGRVQAMRTDATGPEHYRHDAAGRIIERRFADGRVWRWSRDAAGRIVAHTVQGAATDDSTTTALQYAGPRLVRIEHPAETETFTHDSAGRIGTRIVERPTARAGHPRLRYRESFAYDAADRVIRHALPEGGELSYEWGKGRQLRGIAWTDGALRRTQLLSPLRLPSAARAGPLTVRHQPSGAERDAAIASGGYRLGNGVEVRFSLGADGRLRDLAHRLPPRSTKGSWPDWIAPAHASDPVPGLAPAADPGAESGELIDGWRYGYDAAGRISQRSDLRRTLEVGFAYDRQARLIAAQAGHDAAGAEYHAYDAAGEVVGRRVDGVSVDFRREKIDRDAGGLPERLGEFLLRYSADRRLVEVRRAAGDGRNENGNHLLARYDHDALGRRVRKTVFDPGAVPAGRSGSTLFLWDSYRLVGEAAEEDGQPRLKRRYIYAHGVPVAILDYPAGRPLATQVTALSDVLRTVREFITRSAPQVRYVHANEIGTPVAVTDERSRVIWRARHSLFGEARGLTAADISPGFNLNLRLPGQYHDVETGWHDNVLRTYDPRRGDYLEPDPLGPHPLTQPYAYAARDPLRFADPLGLILFAFDGTGNNESSRTNIYWLKEAYNDNDSASIANSDRPYYVEGVGTKWYQLGDRAFAYSLKSKVESQLNALDDYVKAKFENEARVKGTTITPQSPLLITLDVIGFSRGASAARDFINEVLARRNQSYYRDLLGGACVGVHIRFLGLFDTVLSKQMMGVISLGIPAGELGHVAHAVAANEHRALFPLESAESSYAGRGAGANVVERGFVGAHADIGGGYLVEDGSDLADIALNWMHQQAVAAGVPMKPLRAAQRAITDPVVHDESRVSPWNAPPLNGFDDDRKVHYPDQVRKERSADFDGINHAESLAYILPYSEPPPLADPYQDGITQPMPQLSRRVGLVDINRYSDWLAQNYGLTFD